jgi:hypothetical protein
VGLLARRRTVARRHPQPHTEAAQPLFIGPVHEEATYGITSGTDRYEQQLRRARGQHRRRRPEIDKSDDTWRGRRHEVEQAEEGENSCGFGPLDFENGKPKFNFGIDPANFYIDLIGFHDWIVFGGFLAMLFGLSMYWFLIFRWGVIVLCLSLGLFRDFGYSFLWGVFILSRPRVDFALRDRDDALHRDAYHPLTV